jgi:hypothetical protein
MVGGKNYQEKFSFWVRAQDFCFAVHHELFTDHGSLHHTG